MSDSWGAYVSALLRIEAPDGMVWMRPAPVTRTEGNYPDPEGRAIFVITAHNPGGRTASDEENASAQARLVAELESRGLTWWPAAGGDPSWTHVEASAAVIGMTEDDAISLGAQFGQDAIFMLTPRYRQVVGCGKRRITATGWFIGPEAPEHRSPERATSPVDEAKVRAGNRPAEDSKAPPSAVPAGLPAVRRVPDEAAAARRANERAQRVTDGLAQLAEWLRDEVRVGFAASARDGGNRSGGAEQMAARMVDAQAPGVAGSLRGLSRLPGTGVDWPSRLLSSYAMLHLLIRAHERLDALPEGLAAAVRTRVGYRVSRDDVLARPAVTDHWLVLGRRELTQGAVPGRRIWLRGQETGGLAMVLTFARNEWGSWQDWETASLRARHEFPRQPALLPWRAAHAGDHRRATACHNAREAARA